MPTRHAQPVKRPANLSINAELLAQARALDINLSATLERATHVAAHGVFSDGLRGF